MEHIADLTQNGKFAILPGPAPNVTPAHPERITLDTLDASVHSKVERAIASARRWASLKIGGDGRASMVLVATGLKKKDGKPDMDHTGYGCGKTHIARAIQWASYTALDDGTPVAPAGRFYVARDLIELIGSGNTMQELAPPPVEIADGGRVGGTPVIVIDDVGTEGTIPYVSAAQQAYEMQARYFMVINYCYERHISVVITANMTIDEMAAHIGGRAWSRLQQMAPAGLIIDMTGVPDWRRQEGGR